MKLSLEMICEELREYSPRVASDEGADSVEFSGVRLLASLSEPMLPDCLYLSRRQDLARLSRAQLESGFFVFAEQPEQPQQTRVKNALILCEPADIDEVLNRLLSLFEKMNRIEHLLRTAALPNRGQAAMLKVLDEYLPNCLVFAIDSAFNIICASHPKAELNEYLSELLKRGFFTRKQMDQVGRLGYFEDERKYLKFVLYPASRTVANTPFACRSYRFKGTAFSHICCYFLAGKPTVFEKAVLTCYTEELEKFYRNDYIPNNMVISTQQQLLEDLIEPKTDEPEYFRDRCARLHIPFEGSMRLALIEIGYNRAVKTAQLLNQLRTQCPLGNYGVFHYGSYIVLILKDWNGADTKVRAVFDDNFRCLISQLKADNASMGVSLMFSDASKMKYAFRQAEKALELGSSARPGKNAYFYSDFFLEDMLTSYSRFIPLGSLYIQSLDSIIKDDNYCCSNCRLLLCYLCCERNLTATAKLVNMHRNSITYRIEKIQNMLGLDLDDPEVRLRLMISFKALEILGVIPAADTDAAGKSSYVLKE